MFMKRAHCLQHVPFEGPGIFRSFLEQRGYEVTQQLVPEKGLPDQLEDFLLVMGGPMSVNDPSLWIEEEITFIQDAISRNIPVVGVCLGAQLLARALEASVTPCEHFEIGMVPIMLSEEGKDDPVFQSMPNVFEVFQWHGEGFALPSKAVQLASSQHYPVQAFRYGTNVYSLLFHLELDEQGVRTLCRECPEDVARGGIPANILLAKASQAFPQLHACADRLIAYLTSKPS